MTEPEINNMPLFSSKSEEIVQPPSYLYNFPQTEDNAKPSDNNGKEVHDSNVFYQQLESEQVSSSSSTSVLIIL